MTNGVETDNKDVYIALKNPKDYKTSITQILGVENYNDVRSYEATTKYEYDLNSELLRWEAFAFSDSTITMLFSVAGVIIGIIIFTSVFCIRNSFAISITEKMKMYGELASVGATKKQIKKSVIYEAMLLGIIGVPLGIASGIFAIAVLLKIVGAMLGEFLFEGIDGILFGINYLSILISALLGFITIYLSAFISAKRASKVSPINLLRNSEEIKLKQKKLKAPKIINKLFKTGGVLAYKNLKRSKKKYRTTVISIAVSVCIFITMNTFINNMFDFSSNYYEDYDYNIKLSMSNIESEEDLNKLLELEDIDEYFMLYDTKGHDYIRIYDRNKVNKSLDYYSDKAEELGYISMSIKGLDDATFRKFAKKIGENYDKIKDKGILIDNYVDYIEENGEAVRKDTRTYNYKVEDTIIGKYGLSSIDTNGETKKTIYENDKDINIKVGAITEIRPYGIENNYYYGGYLVVNIDRYNDLEFTPNLLTIQSSNPDKLEENITKVNNIVNVRNLDDEVKQEKSMILVIKIFLYGFICVITLIGVTNIFNTITSNMELRQKEFAMLKSIGMTKKEFNRMVNLETIFYGTKSLAYGIILGLIGTLLIYNAFGSENTKFFFPSLAIAISIISVFILIFVIMKYSVGKINKQNTIETIRKDNI